MAIIFHFHFVIIRNSHKFASVIKVQRELLQKGTEANGNKKKIIFHFSISHYMRFCIVWVFST